jgi:hypothetical protein
MSQQHIHSVHGKYPQLEGELILSCCWSSDTVNFMAMLSQTQQVATLIMQLDDCDVDGINLLRWSQNINYTMLMPRPDATHLSYGDGTVFRRSAAAHAVNIFRLNSNLATPTYDRQLPLTLTDVTAQTQTSAVPWKKQNNWDSGLMVT